MDCISLEPIDIYNLIKFRETTLIDNRDKEIIHIIKYIEGEKDELYIISIKGEDCIKRKFKISFCDIMGYVEYQYDK